jgi:hypothetical protein
MRPPETIYAASEGVSADSESMVAELSDPDQGDRGRSYSSASIVVMMVMAATVAVAMVVVAVATFVTGMSRRDRRAIVVVVIMTVAMAIAVMVVTASDAMAGMVPAAGAESQGLGDAVLSTRASALAVFRLDSRHRCSVGGTTGVARFRRGRCVRFRLLFTGRIITTSHLRVRDGAAHGADTQHENEAHDGLL